MQHRWLQYNQARDHMKGLYMAEGWWCEVGERITDCMWRRMPYRWNTVPSINQWPLWQSTLPWSQCHSGKSLLDCEWTKSGLEAFPTFQSFNLDYFLITHVSLIKIKYPTIVSEESEAKTLYGAKASLWNLFNTFSIIMTAEDQDLMWLHVEEDAPAHLCDTLLFKPLYRCCLYSSFDHPQQSLPCVFNVSVHMQAYPELQVRAGNSALFIPLPSYRVTEAMKRQRVELHTHLLSLPLFLCLAVAIVLIIISDLWVWSAQTSRWYSPSESKGTQSCTTIYWKHETSLKHILYHNCFF